jgi:hypothetical protein
MNRSTASVSRSASFLIGLPIAGLMGGILLGVIRGWMWGGDELIRLGYAVSGGFVGSMSGGLAAVLIGVLGRRSLTSLQKIGVLILVAGIVLWAFISLLRTLKSNGSL